MEDAAMEHRDPYLRELGEPTYLVIDPRVKAQPGLHPNHPQPQAWSLLLRQRLSSWVLLCMWQDRVGVGGMGKAL